jgi:chromosome segregation ATPase
MTKLQEADKSVKAAAQELRKLQAEASSVERDHNQLAARTTALTAKARKAEAKLKHLEKQVVAAEEALLRLHNDTTALEAKNDELESERAEKALQLADLHSEINSRKTSVDRELAAYSLSKKQAIRDEILAVNAELQAPQAELMSITEQITNKQEELRLLNQTAIQEQQDVKLAKATIDSDLLEKQAEQTELNEKIYEAKQSLQKLLFERDNAMMTIQKARDEHKKFTDYELKARKILDTKDRELQERETDITTQSQFLRNKRSFLPPL